MKNKRVLISIGIIAALLLYLLISKNINKGGNVPQLKKIDKIDELQIIKNKESIKLNLKDDKWFVNDEFPAEKIESDKLSAAIKDLKFTDYITKENHVIYDLSSENAIQVIAKFDGKILRDVMIGKTSSTNRTTYVKLSDEDKIYLALSDLKVTFSTSIEKLRDKQIYTFEKNDLTWFQVNFKGKTLSFEKKAEVIEVTDVSADSSALNPAKDKEKQKTVEKWICVEFPKILISKNKVDSFLGSLSSVRAESYPDVKKDELKGFICLAKAKIIDREIILSIIKKSDKDKNDYFCSSSESPYVFTLKEWAVKRFFLELKDFQENEKSK